MEILGMKAIVVLFMPAPNPAAAPERTLSVQSMFRLAAPATPRRQTSTPPFWTWFVENPRPIPSSDLAV
jgi:hypothetical protein